MRFCLKIISVFLLIVLLAPLCGCTDSKGSGEDVLRVIESPFKMTASFSQNDFEADIEVLRHSHAAASLKFLSPAEISGMTFLKDGDTVTCDFMGITSELSYSDLQPNSPFKLLFSFLERMASECVSKESGVSYTVKDGALTAKANSGDSLVIEEQKLARITLGGESIVINVKEFQYF